MPRKSKKPVYLYDVARDALIHPDGKTQEGVLARGWRGYTRLIMWSAREGVDVQDLYKNMVAARLASGPLSYRRLELQLSRAVKEMPADFRVYYRYWLRRSGLKERDFLANVVALLAQFEEREIATEFLGVPS